VIELSVAVMAHPRRAAEVERLVRELEREELEPVVVWDRINDRWDTGRRSLLEIRPGATHHLVIQDDALVCRDLGDGLRAALSAVPANPVALYTGAARPRQDYVRARVAWAQDRGEAWIAMEGPLWGVGIVLPVELVEPAVAWGDRHPDILNYDIRLSRHFASIRTPCFYTVPSLLEHRDGESLVEGRTGKGRRAFEWIGRRRSALEVDWRRLPTAPAEGFVPAVGGFACWTCPRILERETQIRYHVKTHELAKVDTP
jgi:hypothetical protein